MRETTPRGDGTGPPAFPSAPAVGERTMLRQREEFLQAHLARIEEQRSGLSSSESEQ